MELLKKSHFYSNFLKEKMENSVEAEKLKKKNLKVRKELKQKEDKVSRFTIVSIVTSQFIRIPFL